MPTISDSQEAITPEPGRWWSYNAGSYAREQRVERGWSETTVDNTVRCLRAWPDRFEASGLPRPIVASDITAEMILAWKSEPWGPGHYCRKPAPLRSTRTETPVETVERCVTCGHRRFGDVRPSRKKRDLNGHFLGEGRCLSRRSGGTAPREFRDCNCERYEPGVRVDP